MNTTDEPDYLGNPDDILAFIDEMDPTEFRFSVGLEHWKFAIKILASREIPFAYGSDEKKVDFYPIGDKVSGGYYLPTPGSDVSFRLPKLRECGVRIAHVNPEHRLQPAIIDLDNDCYNDNQLYVGTVKQTYRNPVQRTDAILVTYNGNGEGFIIVPIGLDLGTLLQERP